MDLNLGLKRALSESDLSSRVKKSCGDPNFINYVFDPPSLTSIAMVAIAVKMYGCPPLSHRLFDSREENHYKEPLQRIEKFVLPQSLKHQLSYIIKNIDQQWKGCTTFFEKSKPLCREYFNVDELYEKNYLSYWTMEGTVDRVKILKNIFDEVKKKNDECIDYRIALEYCMEEYISQFGSAVLRYVGSFDPFAAYWTAFLRNEVGPHLMKDMVFESIREDNLIAFKYFWNKLTEEDKRSNIKEWIAQVMDIIKKRCFYPDLDQNYILCFLLSHLSHSEQKEIFQLYPHLILSSLFRQWPLQRYFLPTFTVMLDFLNENMYVKILKDIFNFINRETELLFREMWVVTPPNLKKSFLCYLKTDFKVEPITQLMCHGCVTTINDILSDTTEEDKREIIFRVAQQNRTFFFLENHTNSDKMAISTIDTMASQNLSEDDYHSFKLEIMSKPGKDLIEKWIWKSDFASANILLNWISQTQEEFKKNKEKYVFLEVKYRRLLIDDEYELVDEFLNWYFETEKEVNEFKISFVCKDNLTHCRKLIACFSRKGTEGWDFFKKFLNFSFHSSDEILNAKNVFKHFVKLDKYFSGMNEEFNSLFMKWCNFE